MLQGNLELQLGFPLCFCFNLSWQPWGVALFGGGDHSAYHNHQARVMEGPRLEGRLCEMLRCVQGYLLRADWDSRGRGHSGCSLPALLSPAMDSSKSGTSWARTCSPGVEAGDTKGAGESVHGATKGKRMQGEGLPASSILIQHTLPTITRATTGNKNSIR